MAGQDSPNDSGGVALVVGDTVKLVGTVSAMDLFNNRFNDIEVTLSHPPSATVFSGPQLGITGADMTVPGPRLKITVPAFMLTKGA